MPKSTRSQAAGKNRGGRILVGRSGRRGATTAVETFIRPQQSLPVIISLALWRWRWEAFTLAAITTTWFKLHASGLNDPETVLVMVGPFAVLLAIGPTRRFCRNRFWCVVTRHRVRACLAEMRTLNYSGNLPFIIGCRSTKVGESVWLWMRPGLSMADLENRSETLAAACWARSARIERHRGNAALIRIDIDRRDPLAKKHIPSPLVGDLAAVPDGEINHDVVLEFIRPDQGAGPVPQTADTKPPATTADDTYLSTEPGDGPGIAVHEPTRKVKKPKATVHADQATQVLGHNGEDVTDYV